MKIIGVTQARIGSSRLPGKVLLSIKKKTLLQYHLERAIKSRWVDKWIVATTNEPGSDMICKIAEQLSVASFRGSIHDVLDRFYQAVKNDAPDYVVRITSDCPLVDPELADEVISYTIEKNLFYCCTSSQFPDGVDVEVFKLTALKEAHENATSPTDREHVTPFIKRRAQDAKLLHEFNSEKVYSNIRFTVDEAGDFTAIQTLIEYLGAGARWETYADFIIKHQDLFTNQPV